MKKNDLEKRFLAVLKEHDWLRPGPTLLGVSGGSDSIALLHLYAAVLGSSRIVVAHMDHGLRETSSRDRDFVVSVCAELGVRCVAEKRPVPELSQKGESEEAAGRRLRYELYEEICQKFGCELIALGHTRNDLAESVLMNVARGSGLRGLAGIPLQRGRCIRPLLGFYREELRAYLSERGLSWVDDETNDLALYQRNRVRNIVIPCLREHVNLQIVSHLAALADEAYAWRREQEARSREAFHAASVPDQPWPTLDLKRLRRMSPWERAELLRFVGRRLELDTLTRERAGELDRLVVSSGRWIFQWGSEVDVTACGGVVAWHPAAEKRLMELHVSAGVSARWGGWRVTVQKRKPDDPAFVMPVELGSDGTVVLKNNTVDSVPFNDPFPMVLHGGGRASFHNGNCQNAKSENESYCVKLTPLRGKWRNCEWN